MWAGIPICFPYSKLVELGPSVCPGFGWSMAHGVLGLACTNPAPVTARDVGCSAPSPRNPELPKRCLTVQHRDSALRSHVTSLTLAEVSEIVMLHGKGNKTAPSARPLLYLMDRGTESAKSGSCCARCAQEGQEDFTCC